MGKRQQKFVSKSLKTFFPEITTNTIQHIQTSNIIFIRTLYIIVLLGRKQTSHNQYEKKKQKCHYWSTQTNQLLPCSFQSYLGVLNLLVIRQCIIQKHFPYNNNTSLKHSIQIHKICVCVCDVCAFACKAVQAHTSGDG